VTRQGKILLSFALLATVLIVTVAIIGMRASPKPASVGATLGGPFELVEMTGAPVTEKSLLGKPTAIFFGFTYCPEVCPTTLMELTSALKALGPEADDLNVVFVSVDPARDTPEQMKLYLSNFDPRIRGFTGTPKAIAKTAKAYRVYYREVPVEGGSYTVDHSSSVYLFDAKGRFVEPIAYGAPHERVVAQLRSLAKQG
jgi:protein SCO1/2